MKQKLEKKYIEFIVKECFLANLIFYIEQKLPLLKNIKKIRYIIFSIITTLYHVYIYNEF